MTINIYVEVIQSCCKIAQIIWSVAIQDCMGLAQQIQFSSIKQYKEFRPSYKVFSHQLFIELYIILENLQNFISSPL